MRPGAAPTLAALLAVGCSTQAGSTPVGSVLMPTSADLAPDANPGVASTFRLSGPAVKGTPAPLEFEVGLHYAKVQDKVSFDVILHGELLEQEAYESTPSAFRLLSAAETSFSPALDLIHFPAHEGETWEWDGKTIYAGITRPAHATIRTKHEANGLSTEVDLKVQTDPGRPDLTQKLRFRFEKGKGVVSRSFGDLSARRPVGEAWLP